MPLEQRVAPSTRNCHHYARPLPLKYRNPVPRLQSSQVQGVCASTLATQYPTADRLKLAGNAAIPELLQIVLPEPYTPTDRMHQCHWGFTPMSILPHQSLRKALGVMHMLELELSVTI